ncbi:MAG: thiamine/thiamine pyrophosphate ABC transporter permease ThiP [Rhodobacterales bacterium]|nr:thiamine/thiamine pyrophosphate ABC transporter permease ThiP [Rhodobacterales bacterium]MDX5414118.1 thiamine/thiamine pyrophosphate ABC transporter permease ThiP [Rhodobacterales bacterium]
MAARPVPLKQRRFWTWFGWGAAALVTGLVLAPLLAVLWRAGGGAWPGPADWAALRFTVVQAILSALFSILLAIPVARALARREFPGRRVMITLMGAPFILPVIVAVFGLLAIFGRGGIVNHALTLLNLPPVQIYGLHGVVLAHVFFNLPLATRILLQGWQGIPAERFRLAAGLGLGPREVFRLLEWPMLRATLPGAALVIFAICLSSFAVALTLGGGPRATTVELAIYQAFRFDFDLGRAAVLAVIQIMLVTVAATLALRVSRMDGFGRGMDRPLRRWDAETAWSRMIDSMVLTLAALFLLLPLGAVIWRGLNGLDAMPPQVWEAASVSLVMALASTLLSVSLALAMAHLALDRPGVETLGLLGVAASPLVIGTGLFLLINPISDPTRWAFGLTATINALAALPFALRVLAPALRDLERDFGPLADSLGMTATARLRWLILPRLRRPLGFSAGLAAALSMGDLGVIVLFADPQSATLPLQILRLMGAYRMDAAAGAALLLLALSLLLFWLFDQGGRRDVDR